MLSLNFAGQSIIPKWNGRYMQTVVFNIFIFIQIFNQYKQVVAFFAGRDTY
jgi:hypothetical protein